MLKIKLSISDSGINADGLFIDSRGNTCNGTNNERSVVRSINKSFQCEETAMNEFADMRDRDCEFSLVIIRKV